MEEIPNVLLPRAVREPEYPQALEPGFGDTVPHVESLPREEPPAPEHYEDLG
jgi:hypothetical protein